MLVKAYTIANAGKSKRYARFNSPSAIGKGDPMSHPGIGGRFRRAGVYGVFFLIFPILAFPAAIDPGSFQTAAKFSVDKDGMSLTTAVATIEPRLGAPGYFWLRINFYSFPVATEDIPGILAGDTRSMDKKWGRKSSNLSDYNHSNASILLSMDKIHKVWQVDMAVPGHTCTIAPYEKDVQNFLQEYQFDGQKLKLKSKGTYVCDMKFMGIANQEFAWEMDVNLPVFEKQDGKK